MKRGVVVYGPIIAGLSWGPGAGNDVAGLGRECQVGRGASHHRGILKS